MVLFRSNPGLEKSDLGTDRLEMASAPLMVALVPGLCACLTGPLKSFAATPSPDVWQPPLSW